MRSNPAGTSFFGVSRPGDDERPVAAATRTSALIPIRYISARKSAGHNVEILGARPCVVTK
jgi:hypothetical protein